mgnify:CR=1 FL=1|jgi:hypothetical protein
MNVLNKRVSESLVCMVAVSVLLQLVLPAILTMEPLSGVVGALPGVSSVLEAHKSEQIGGSIVIALITIIAAFVAPQLCGMVSL